MTAAASLLCLAALLPAPQGDLRLPPRKTPATPPTTQRPLTEIERFRRDLQFLNSSPSQVESKLLEMGSGYPAMEPLILEVARTARANEMGNLMIVARRFGTPRVADELLFQLLARPLGEATRATVEAMVQLKGADAKRALKECIRGRIASAQRHATDVLATLAGAEDLQFALELTSEQNLDLQLRGVDLLRAVPGERSAQRLIELLSKEPTVAAAACNALVLLGTSVVGPLQSLCTAPPIDRSFDYGAFALAQIERANGGALLPATMVPVLGARLAQRDLLSRCLDAIALADLAFRSDTQSGEVFPDAAIVEALLEVVQPAQFVPNLDMLRRPAEERLVRTTGRVVVGAAGLTWREWWKDQRDGFVGMRANVAVDGKSAGNAVVVWRQEQRHLRLLGENRAGMAPVEGALEIVLTSAQMLELVSALKAKGFGNVDLTRVDSGLPLVRQLQVQVAGGRAQVSMPASMHPAFEELVHIVQQQVDAELWQLYRNPADEPDRAAFWRTERRWREANPDAAGIGRRFARRIVQNWHVLSPGLRIRGVEYLLGHANRRELLLEEDGDRILSAVARQKELGELELRLLELAAAVPGDRVWRQCVDLAARSNGGGRNAVRAVFAVLGPEAVLSALQDPNPVVRRSAVEEVIIVRDHRAGPRLVELLVDEDAEVRRVAANACGSLQVTSASGALIAAIVAEDTPSLMRRECLRALGRVGGDQAFPVLQRALSATEKEDKEAALRGIGELRDPRAAHLLAELAVVAHGKDLGALARYYLQRQGGILVVPAIRAQLQAVQDPAIRAHLVLVLGAYQDPTVVPDLMDLLSNDTHAASAAALLEGTTGIDLSTASDRIGAIEAWWRRNRRVPQWQWLLDGLKAANVATVLHADQFGPGAGLAPVPELARLLVEAKEPRLWVLSSAVLRTVTNEDFGVVTPSSATEAREGVAARYRMLTETARAAQGR
ncbi:MAG TPA: HEAT repeat domain-containing protein [Planctomycetota bacterium]|nr:HEAT repeat domain-containing protein [Planctomycetota bacterium]